MSAVVSVAGSKEVGDEEQAVIDAHRKALEKRQGRMLERLAKRDAAESRRPKSRNADEVVLKMTAGD